MGIFVYAFNQLFQITVAKKKEPLCQSGVAAVVTALSALYQRMAQQASTKGVARAWMNKCPLPEVLFLVPHDMHVSLNHLN